MPTTRYREARTLVRGIRRLPKEDRAAYKLKVARMRAHFVRFNTDVSELCQWLMGLRPGGKRQGEETRPFWDFFLEPTKSVDKVDEDSVDRIRLAVFRVAVGWDAVEKSNDHNLLPSLLESIETVENLPLTPTSQKLLIRLQNLSDSHRLVLLKAAAEWIVTRYQRGYENALRQHEEWEKEKTEWESRHPELTQEIRHKYNEVFKQMEITRKRPRVCSWQRLETLRDDCEYAGERIDKKNHSQMCRKYRDFLDESQSKERSQIKRFFPENAERYLVLRNHKRSLSRLDALDVYISGDKKRAWFKDAWERYIRTVKIHEDALINKYGCKLPHCVEFGDQNECHCNPHTNECKLYRNLLKQFDSKTRALEPIYREWRRDYLSGPRKPSFRYPSSRLLPMPKIFGKNFFTIDFENSIVGLRLDDMAEGEYIEFGFTPWPKVYEPEPHEARITSAHVNFIGVKPRIAFRFDAIHKESRFCVSQDDLEFLRSRVFPRKAQDQEFLDEARKRLLESFACSQDSIRILAVDLGEKGAVAAVFEGRKFLKSAHLRIAKVELLRETFELNDSTANDEQKRRGLRREHLDVHGEGMAKGASEIGAKRNKLLLRDKVTQEQTRDEDIPVVLGVHDLRGLSIHVRRMINDWVRLNARQVIELAERESVDLIAFESLRGFLPPGYDKLDPQIMKKKKWLAFFSYGRIRRKVTEKAVERGMRVITEPYFYSSQFCCECGRQQEDNSRWLKNKKQHKFQCENEDCAHYGSLIDSDENAARVLGRVFWGEIVLPTEVSAKVKN